MLAMRAVYAIFCVSSPMIGGFDGQDAEPGHGGAGFKRGSFAARHFVDPFAGCYQGESRERANIPATAASAINQAIASSWSVIGGRVRLDLRRGIVMAL